MRLMNEYIKMEINFSFFNFYFETSIFELWLFNIVCVSVIYIGKGNEDGVDKILKLIVERFIVFPPLKMEWVLWGFRVGIFYVFYMTFLYKYKIVIQNLWIDLISIYPIHILILFIYIPNSYEICSNSNL